MSGGMGLSGGFLPTKTNVTRITGRHLVTRQPLTLMTKVPLNGLVVSQLKQQLPIFRAVELASMNTQFAQTAFLKPSLKLKLRDGDGDLVLLTVKEERKSISQQYKKRTLTVSTDDLASVLKNITDNRIVRTLNTVATNDDLLKVLLEMEKLAPSRLAFWEFTSEENLLPALIGRFAHKVQRAKFCSWPYIDWLKFAQFEQCLQLFTNLQRLNLRGIVDSVAPTLPPYDWLKNALVANSQLKRLLISDTLFLSAIGQCAIPTMVRIEDVRLYFRSLGMANNVETDLCGRGQCSLTKLVLAMPQDGHLTLFVHQCNLIVMLGLGPVLRLVYYLLSLHKTGKSVVVKMADFPDGARMTKFVNDLSHFYSPPLMETTPGANGDHYRYRVRCGSVALYL